MYLFDTDDLRDLILDEEIFSLFNLLEREKQILHMHLLKGYTFKFIGGVFNIRPQTAHEIYKRTLEKMRKQIIIILRSHNQLQA